MRPSSHASINLIKRDKGYVGKGGDVGGHVHIVDPPKLAEGCNYVIFCWSSGKVSQEHPLHDLSWKLVRTILSHTYPIVWIRWFLHCIDFCCFLDGTYSFLENIRNCQNLYTYKQTSTLTRFERWMPTRQSNRWSTSTERSNVDANANETNVQELTNVDREIQLWHQRDGPVLTIQPTDNQRGKDAPYGLTEMD